MKDTENIPPVEKQTAKSPSKKSKAQGNHNKKRFQLFDPAAKCHLIDLCDGLVQLNLENDNNKKESEDDNSVSLDFDGGSSDDEEGEIENLPIDLAPPDHNSENSQTIKQTRLFCGSCNVQFTDLAEQRLHYTLDWHRYNIKRKLAEQRFITEERFSELIDDLSSIDGSDNEEEDAIIATTSGETNQVDRLLEKLSTSDLGEEHAQPSSSQKLEKSPKMFFMNGKGQIISCYKGILPSLEKQHEDTGEFSSTKILNSITNPLRITIIMASGGHFAAAVFDGNTCTHHKTFHSYTVRAKQGGSQAAYDSKSATSHAKSAGASLRRYNQQSFAQHVQDLMASWKIHLAESALVFYRAVSANAAILFNSKNAVLSKGSKNLRTIPFPTQRPTFSEVKRVHSLLTTVRLYESMDAFLSAHSHLTTNAKKGAIGPTKQKNKKDANRAKSRSPMTAEEPVVSHVSGGSTSDEDCGPLEETEPTGEFSCSKEREQRKEGKKRKKKINVPKVFRPDGILVDLLEALQQKNVESFTTLLDKVKQDGECLALNQPVDLQSSTLLHEASKINQRDIVWALLETGCDPATKDKSGKCPYNYVETRACRETFRKFMGQYPDKYDYKKAHVPPPLSEEQEMEKAEKKKQLNKVKREKDKQKKIEKMERDKEAEEQKRYLGLSDREKRALAAEQRILAQCKKNSEKIPILVRCFECALDITGRVPFEYNNNLFCTPNCLGIHRNKFPTQVI